MFTNFRDGLFGVQGNAIELGLLGHTLVAEVASSGEEDQRYIGESTLHIIGQLGQGWEEESVKFPWTQLTDERLEDLEQLGASLDLVHEEDD